MSMMPESPVYLQQKGRFADANASYLWLRGEIPNEDAVETSATASFKEMLALPQYRRPLLVVLGLMFFQQFSGINAVVFYSQSIFSEAGSSLSPSISAFLLALAMVFGTGLAVGLVEKFGRRSLLLASAALMSASIAGLGAFFLVASGKDNFRWLPLTSLICYVIAFSIGFGPLPWTVNAEIFPEASKAKCSAFAFAFNFSCAFLVTFSQPQLPLAPSHLYFAFSVICALAAVFVGCKVPETKGKSRREIAKLFEDCGGDDECEDEEGKENIAYVENESYV